MIVIGKVRRWMFRLKCWWNCICYKHMVLKVSNRGLTWCEKCEDYEAYEIERQKILKRLESEDPRNK